MKVEKQGETLCEDFEGNYSLKDNFGETALMEAAAVGHPQLCKILLENCANVAYKSPTGLSAKDFASEHEVLSNLEFEVISSFSMSHLEI